MLRFVSCLLVLAAVCANVGLLRNSINIHATGDEQTLRNLNIAGFKLSSLENHDIGWTSLTYAAHAGRVDVVDRLLRDGVDPNAVSAKNGWTALMHAAGNGDVDVVERLLMLKQLDIMQRSDDGKTAQEIAYDSNFPVVSKFIAEAALSVAISRADKGTIRAMLNKGAFVDTRNSVGYSALLMACRRGDSDFVRELLDVYGADVNAVDNDGWSGLMLAVMSENQELATVLLGHGANAMSRSYAGHTAKSCAASTKHPGIMALLTDHVEQLQTQAPQQQTKNPVMAARLQQQNDPSGRRLPSLRSIPHMPSIVDSDPGSMDAAASSLVGATRGLLDCAVDALFSRA